MCYYTCVLNNTTLLPHFLQMKKRLREITLAIHKCEKAIENAIAGHYENEVYIIDFMQKKIEKLIAEQEEIGEALNPVWYDSVYPRSNAFTY